MHFAAFLLVAASHIALGGLQSPLTLPIKEPAAVEFSRGYFERQGGKWVEDHRNAFERGLYNGAGHLIGVVEIDVVDTTTKVKQELDMDGRIVETGFYSSSGLKGRIAFAHDAAGRVTETTYLDDEGKLVERRLTTYSKRGLVALESVYRRIKGKDPVALAQESQYAYDKAGNLAKRTTTLLTPKKRVVLVQGYGAGGTVATEQTFDEWGDPKDTFVYRYEAGSTGFWTKQLKLKKLGKPEAPVLVPVDVIYRKLVPLANN